MLTVIARYRAHTRLGSIAGDHGEHRLIPLGWELGW
jgi:hypothetical protein